MNKFYTYANRKFVNRTPIGPLKRSDAALVTDPVKKAELLQSVFSSISVDNGRIPSLSTSSNRGDKISSVYFTVNLVKRAIERLRVKSKGGPNSIPPIFFKTCNPSFHHLYPTFTTCASNKAILAPD
jgi:hypothetical protein